MKIEVGAAGGIMPPADSVIRTARRNEEKGYDAVWWPDHWMGWFPESIWTPDITPLAAFQPSPHVYLDPVATMAAVAVSTERIKLGTSVTEPVRRHPALLANEWLTLDHLSKGRAILGLGAGEAENIEPYGLDYSRPASRFEEAVTIIRLLWESDEKVDFDGEFWTLRDAVLGLGPHEPGRYPPIWTGARGPRMLDITGRLADGWLPPQMPLEEYSDGLARIRRAAESAGRDLDAFTPGLYALTVVADDHEECHRLIDQTIPKSFLLVAPSRTFEEHGARHPFGDDFDGIRDYIPTRFGRDETLKAIDAIPEEVVHASTVHGTPDELVAMARDFGEVGLRHLALWNITFLGDPTKVKESFHLLDDVAEAIRREG